MQKGVLGGQGKMHMVSPRIAWVTMTTWPAARGSESPPNTEPKSQGSVDP